MKLKRTAAKTTFVGAMSIAAAVSTQGWHRLIHGARVRHRGRFRHLTTGQGANVAPPGNPGTRLPPPGHGGPMPLDAVAPTWAQPAPPRLSGRRRCRSSGIRSSTLGA